jgi:hypothetical protein
VACVLAIGVTLAAVYLTGLHGHVVFQAAPSETPTSPAEALAAFRAGPEFEGLDFSYPASWQAIAYQSRSSFSTTMVYLSNQAMHKPCPDGSCGPGAPKLQPGGFIAWWSERGTPSFTFDTAVGDPLTVGGRRAKLSVRSEVCWIGGDVLMSAVVERPEAPNNWYELDACIRGPGVAEIESQVRALLASTTLAAGSPAG